MITVANGRTHLRTAALQSFNRWDPRAECTDQVRVAGSNTPWTSVDDVAALFRGRRYWAFRTLPWGPAIAWPRVELPHLERPEPTGSHCQHSMRSDTRRLIARTSPINSCWCTWPFHVSAVGELISACLASECRLLIGCAAAI